MRPEPTAPDEAALQRQFRLTPQELRVAQLLARGRSNREVAVALGVSPRTARYHTEAIFRKLGVRSRGAVAAMMVGAADRPLPPDREPGSSTDSRDGPGP